MHLRSNNYKYIADEYSQIDDEGVYKTVYSLLDLLVKKYEIKGCVLDHGCGGGRFSRYLKETYGFNVVGVDISEDMICLANKKDSDGLYYVIDETGLPFENASFDFVFQAFVLMECSSSNEILRILIDICRVIKDKGMVIIIVANVDNGVRQWPLLYRDLPERKKLENGFPYEVYISKISMPVIDYYWSNMDYMALFEKAGFFVDGFFGSGDDVLFSGDDVMRNSKSVCFYCYCLKKGALL